MAHPPSTQISHSWPSHKYRHKENGDNALFRLCLFVGYPCAFPSLSLSLLQRLPAPADPLLTAAYWIQMFCGSGTGSIHGSTSHAAMMVVL